MKKIYIVIQIGCIECGVPSKVVGSFTTKKKAEKYDREHPWNSWEQHGGDGRQEIFESKLQ